MTSVKNCGSFIAINCVLVAVLLLITVTPLGSQAPALTVIDFPGAMHTRVMSINAAGEIAGTYVKPDFTTHGFVLDSDGYRTIDFPGAIATQVLDISARGDVVGLRQPGPQSFLLTEGTFHSIVAPGALTGTAAGVSASGDIVGQYSGADGVVHGYVRRGDTFRTIDVPDATLTVASDINEAGDIVGRYQTSPGPFYRMFLLSRDGLFTSIEVPGALSTGAPGTRAGINLTGEIVGPYTGPDGKMRGFLLDAQGFKTIDFPNTQRTLAAGINPQGHIVGYFTDLNGIDHGYLLRRVPE